MRFRVLALHGADRELARLAESMLNNMPLYELVPMLTMEKHRQLAREDEAEATGSTPALVGCLEPGEVVRFNFQPQPGRFHQITPRVTSADLVRLSEQLRDDDGPRIERLRHIRQAIVDQGGLPEYVEAMDMALARFGVYVGRDGQ